MGVSARVTMAMLLPHHDLVLPLEVLNCGTVTARTVPNERCTVIFSSYFAIAAHYTGGVHCYSKVAVGHV